MRYGIDYEALPVEQVKVLGASFVCRYLSTAGNPKNLTREEARALSAHGVDVVVVFETTADRALEGRRAGEYDAHAALTQALGCGMVGARPIFFAVDFDSSSSPSATDGYFDGCAAVLGHGRCGPYGGFAVCEHQLDRGFHWAWQTYAWSDGRWGRAQLQQYQNGASYDHDRAGDADFGQWRYLVPPYRPEVSPFALLVPHERAEADRLEQLRAHLHLHPHPTLEQTLVRLVGFRKAVWLAAVKGKTTGGKDITPGWGIEHRTERYETLSRLTGWPPKS